MGTLGTRRTSWPTSHLSSPSGSNASAACEECAGVKLHSVFLRKGCILPDRLQPLREPFGDNWTLVQEMPALVLDKKIHEEGWHVMWMRGTCLRRGFGLTQEEAAHRALARALNGVARRFDAAELASVQVSKYPGFHIAKVKLQPRQIRRLTALDSACGTHPQAVSAR